MLLECLRRRAYHRHEVLETKTPFSAGSRAFAAFGAIQIESTCRYTAWYRRSHVPRLRSPRTRKASSIVWQPPRRSEVQSRAIARTSTCDFSPTDPILLVSQIFRMIGALTSSWPVDRAGPDPDLVHEKIAQFSGIIYQRLLFARCTCKGAVTQLYSNDTQSLLAKVEALGAATVPAQIIVLLPDMLGATL